MEASTITSTPPSNPKICINLEYPRVSSQNINMSSMNSPDTNKDHHLNNIIPKCLSAKVCQNEDSSSPKPKTNFAI